VFWMLYDFFWVIPRRLNFHILFTGDSFVVMEAMSRPGEGFGVFEVFFVLWEFPLIVRNARMRANSCLSMRVICMDSDLSKYNWKYEYRRKWAFESDISWPRVKTRSKRRRGMSWHLFSQIRCSPLCNSCTQLLGPCPVTRYGWNYVYLISTPTILY